MATPSGSFMWIRSAVSYPLCLCVPEMEFNLDLGIELMDTHPLLRAVCVCVCFKGSCWTPGFSTESVFCAGDDKDEHREREGSEEEGRTENEWRGMCEAVWHRKFHSAV